MSNKSSPQHDVEQWDERNLEGELKSFNGRTIVNSFNKYLTNKNSRIIEAGCGLGAWCEWFVRQGYNIEGIEYDSNIVERAKKIKEDIDIYLGDITELAHADNTFDAYVSLGVIEHCEHGPMIALKEAVRVLKPNGLGFFTTPVLTPLRRFISHPIRNLYFLKQITMRYPVFFWEYRFTKKELRDYLEEAGFEIIDEDIDDYFPDVKNRHIGLWADWFFLRKKGGEIWELNKIGVIILTILKLFPASWYCAGYLYVVRARNDCCELAKVGYRELER